ncbi:MAG: dienelactone hydrolase family protein [Candidatus Dormibacteraeota bacterium]|nr:dienelactone hydrolase family protein [Candidatus Dormibacteraeota bacterium]
MTQVALFHSALGVRAGIRDAADRLRAQGHVVTVVDQYGGRVFDDLDEANRLVGEIGFPALLQRALDAVAELPDGFICMGFSNGGGMAEHVALHRDVAGAILCSGTLPIAMLGSDSWPASTPVQIHYMEHDPRRPEGWAESVAASVRDSNSEVEFYEYPGAAHLFTDESLSQEFDAQATELLWARVLTFCRGLEQAERV